MVSLDMAYRSEVVAVFDTRLDTPPSIKRRHPDSGLARLPDAIASRGSLRSQHRSVVPINPLAPLMSLLGLHRKRGDRSGFKPPDRDRVAGLLAVPVGSLGDPMQRRVDLGHQLPLALAGTQLDAAVGFGRCPVSKIRVVLVLVLKMLKGLLNLVQDVFPPGQQLLAEVVPLALIHKRFFVGRAILVALGRPEDGVADVRPAVSTLRLIVIALTVFGVAILVVVAVCCGNPLGTFVGM